MAVRTHDKSSNHQVGRVGRTLDAVYPKRRLLLTPTLEESLREELVATNNDYRRLFQEHQDYDRRLEALNRKDSYSQQDELEEKQIKLTKLHLKDQMEAIYQAVQSITVSS